MQKTIQRPVPAARRRTVPEPPTRNRKWLNIAAVAVVGSAIGLGLSTFDGTLSPQEIAEIRAEQMVEYRAGQWATQNAPTPEEIAALRYSQYPEAHQRLWESRQP